MSEASIKVIRRETKEMLSSLLNPEKIIPTAKGLPRDWRGLAEMCEVGGELMPNLQKDDPTAQVLQLWFDKSSVLSTIENLISFLKELDRFDIIDDITPLIEKDIEYYSDKPIIDPINPIEIEDDSNILTYDDADRHNKGLALQIYDAFILFDDDDIAFATDIVKKLETQYSLSLCVKDRDMVLGHRELDSVIRLISSRCRRVIVVFSTAFLQSPMNKYFCSLAQLEGIENSYRKIIPCIYKPCNLPLGLRGYHALNFNRSEKLFGNFWDQLFKSITNTSPSTNASVCSNQTQRVPLSANEMQVQIKSNTTAKSLNHVKFRTLESPIEEEDLEIAEEKEGEPKKEPSSPSPSLEPIKGELKKKPSFYKKLKKYIHGDAKTEEISEQVNNGADVQKKKKRFWQKNSKMRVAVAN